MSEVISKSYSSGDVISSCKPIAHILFHKHKAEYCNNCLASSSSLKKCAKCHEMFYCNRMCQKNDWKTAHKHECNHFAKHWPLIADTINQCPYLSLITRLVFMINSDQSIATNKYCTYNGQQICFNDLEFDENEAKRNEIIDRILIILPLFQELNIEFIKNFENVDLCVESLSRMLVRVCTNHFGLLSSGMSPNTIGIGIYIEMSAFKHSCLPNAAFVNNGIKMEIRAMKQIEPNEAITISYIDLEIPKIERQSLLKKIRYLDCKCEKCVTNDDFDYKKLNDLGVKYIDIVMNPDSQNLHLYEFFSLESMLKLGKEMIDLRKQLYVHYNPNLSSNMFLHSIHLIEAMNKRVCDQTRHSIKPFITETLDHLRVTHGIDHYFYKLLNESKLRNNI